MALRQRVRTSKIQAWISSALLAELDVAAHQLRVPRSAILRRALVAYLHQPPAPQPNEPPASPAN